MSESEMSYSRQHRLPPSGPPPHPRPPDNRGEKRRGVPETLSSLLLDLLTRTDMNNFTVIRNEPKCSETSRFNPGLRNKENVGALCETTSATGPGEVLFC